MKEINGVRLTNRDYKRLTKRKMPLAEILAFPPHQRAQALRFADVAEFINNFAYRRPLDYLKKQRPDGSYVRYWLYKCPAGIFDTDAYFVVYDDIVPGSEKLYMSGVPPCATVADAMAWKFSDRRYGLSPQQWLDLRPGVDMN